MARLTPLLAALALALALLAPAAADRNPCHKNKNGQGKGVTCERVQIPPLMCSRCRLKYEFTATGHFGDCKSIYDLDDPECQRQLRYYANKNKACDPVRFAQVQDFSNADNKEGLDYFMYSVCEQCCDCIVRGSKKEEWFRRKKDGTNLSAVRGNCPAHGFYDICKIWPKVKYVTRPNGDVDTEATDLCTDLRTWRSNPANNNWLLKDTSVVTDNVVRFFNRFFKVLNCQRKDVWSPCVDLETAQGRL